MREFDLLSHVFKANVRLGEHVAIPPGDDMAMIRMSGGTVLIGVDQLVGGRHVDLDRVPVPLVGRKAMTRCLSDVAAMAARPSCSLVAVTLPPDYGSRRARELFDAMRDAAEEYGCPLVGGDIAFHDRADHPLVCTVTVIAEPGPTPPITRDGAEPGDTVYVTGTLGGSLQPDGRGRHLTFEPRIDAAIALAASLGDRLHAMIDLSDGLGRDASHLAAASNTQFRLRADDIPRDRELDWRHAVGEGEDYELCFTAGGDVPRSIDGLPVTPVGEVRARPADDDRLVLVISEGGEWAAEELGWQHEA
ncbi:MAG: thiamine-phosphate kinase [Planctomycetota bacterium]